jgi:hypothetical protein
MNPQRVLEVGYLLDRIQSNRWGTNLAREALTGQRGLDAYSCPKSRLTERRNSTKNPIQTVQNPSNNPQASDALPWKPVYDLNPLRCEKVVFNILFSTTTISRAVSQGWRKGSARCRSLIPQRSGASGNVQFFAALGNWELLLR